MLKYSQSVPHVVSAMFLLSPYVLWTLASWYNSIYSVDVLLYLYALPIAQSSTSILKSLPELQSELSLRS